MLGRTPDSAGTKLTHIMRDWTVLSDCWRTSPASESVSTNELVPGHRRFRFQSHYIFYTEETDHVLIRRLIHVKQALRPGLFE
jgi:hypothetical protein